MIISKTAAKVSISIGLSFLLFVNMGNYRERRTDMREQGTVMAATKPPIDAAAPARTETATFGLG